MNWKTGDKAVALRPKNGWKNTVTKTEPNAPNGLPIKGNIYVVEGIHHPSRGVPGLFIAGLPVFNSIGTETTWVAKFFRKVVPRSERVRAKAFLSNA